MFQKISASTNSKKRKKSEVEDNNNKPKKAHAAQNKLDIAKNVIDTDSLKNTVSMICVLNTSLC